MVQTLLQSSSQRTPCKPVYNPCPLREEEEVEEEGHEGHENGARMAQESKIQARLYVCPKENCEVVSERPGIRRQMGQPKKRYAKNRKEQQCVAS